MDDFGVGYSSMMMLKSIHIDKMKLDKSFVDDYNDKRGSKIIVSVIELARSLNIPVTAEGVETGEQYEFFKSSTAIPYRAIILPSQCPLRNTGIDFRNLKYKKARLTVIVL